MPQLQQPLPLCLSYSQPLIEAHSEQRSYVPAVTSQPHLALQQQLPYQPAVLHKVGHDLPAQQPVLLQPHTQQLIPGVCDTAGHAPHSLNSSLAVSLPPVLHTQHSLLTHAVSQQQVLPQQPLQLAVSWPGSITAAVPSASAASLPSTLPGCGMMGSLPAYASQQQAQHLEPQQLESKNWGPEELRQLLDLLGDQQQQDGVQQKCSNEAVTGVVDSSSNLCVMVGGLEQGQMVTNHPSVQPLMC